MGIYASIHGVRPDFIETCKEDISLFQQFALDNQTGEDYLDMDKAWGVLTFLLGGDEAGFPDDNNIFSFAIIGMEQTIGNSRAPDMGMSPAFYLTAHDVELIADLLEKVSHEDLLEYCQPQIMGDIYPSVWDEMDKAAIVDYVLPYFNALRDFYRLQANKGNAIVSYLS